MNKTTTLSHSLARRWTRRLGLSLFILMLHLSASAQQQLLVEYWIDNDPGMGLAQTVSATIGSDGNISFDAVADGLAPGSHLLGFRAYSVNETGNNYGPTLTQNFIVPNTGEEALISRVEYFWDDDPGYGEGTSIAISPDEEITLQNVSVSAENLTPGVHLLGLRAYGNGGWGPTLRQQVMVIGAENDAIITYLEYFWNDDPGFGQATGIALTPATELRMDDIEIPADKDPTTDLLFVRAYGGEGWGPTITCTVEELIDIAEADLAALRKFYADFGGETWNGRQWDTTTDNTASVSWSGVDFDSEGHVTAIELPDRNISGTLSVATALTLPRLGSLDLSGNLLRGDAAALANGERLPLLATLDLSFNQIDEVSALLPPTITTLNLSNQHRARNNNKVFPGLDEQTAIGLDVSNEMAVSVPSVLSYNHTWQSMDAHPQLTAYDRNLNTKAWLTWSAALGAYTFSPSGMPMKEAQDAEVIIVPTTTSGENYANAYNSAYRAQLHFTEGDANLSGWTDVNDVQRTLNYVLNTNNSSTFGLWAANTYDDDEYDAESETINIQDIVSTVNIVLANEGSPGSARRRVMPAEAASTNVVFADGRTLMLDANDEVAAFSLHLRGAKSSQVKLLLNSRQWQMQTRDTGDGMSLVVFSPTGSTLPTGLSQLLRWTADAEPTSMQATDIEARELPVTLHGSVASTVEYVALPTQQADASIYDLQGRRLNTQHSTLNNLKPGIYIVNGQKIRR